MAEPRPWKTFSFDSYDWDVYLVDEKHPKLKSSAVRCLGQVFLEENEIYLRDDLTATRLRNMLAHEIQHIIEEWADVDYEAALPNEDLADIRTDLVAKGWLYLLRHNPELVKFFQE